MSGLVQLSDKRAPPEKPPPKKRKFTTIIKKPEHMQKYTGVTWEHGVNKWRVRICSAERGRESLGCFLTAEEGAEAYACALARSRLPQNYKEALMQGL
jgi:hypothetical protein